MVLLAYQFNHLPRSFEISKHIWSPKKFRLKQVLNHLLSVLHNKIIIALDQELRIIEANDFAMLTFGFDFKPDRQYPIPLPIDIEKPLRQAFSNNKKNHLLAFHVEFNARTYSVKVSHSTTQGSEVDYLLLFEDFSEHSSTHQMHQESIMVFDGMSEGLMITDTHNHVTTINRGFTDITGYDEEDILGKDPAILGTGRHKHSFQKEIQHIVDVEGHWSGEISNRKKNGEIALLWLSLSAVKNHAGKITSYVSVFSDITQSRQSQQQLYTLANHDVLTGLPNRRLLTELLDHAIKRAERSESKLALLFIDLDRFKNVNDSLGHHAGDQLLSQVARRFSAAVRESDTVARLGGDEFVILLDRLNHENDAADVAKKIIEAMRPEFIIGHREFFIGASIGISVYPKDGESHDDLLKAADIAMYQVKNHGKNHFLFYSKSQSESTFELFTLDTQLRRALKKKQFEVLYQPQISLVTGKIIGAEALLRWHHPELGMVSPAKFIPLAEETGLIVPIGEWVLREACLAINRCAKLGYALNSVSVNVSGIQIHRSNFADAVCAVLMETGCNPNTLELEITESAIMNNAEYVIEIFQRIKEMGVTLALDDFGTGYSSLSYLKRFPLDRLKIDQSFVRDLPHDPDDGAICAAIIGLSKSLGLAVIAEGVENKAQADFIYSQGCLEAQGYLYSPAIKLDAFIDMLSKQK